MDVDFGQILPYATNALYSPTYTYGSMETCLDEYNSEWLSLEDGNDGHALPGYNEDGSAKESDYWRCLVNVYRSAQATKGAIEASASALGNAGKAKDQADYAKRQGDNAKDQADYARNMADHPAYIGDGTNGDENYWYLWDYDRQEYVRGAYAKGDNLDYDSMTQQERETLVADIRASLITASTATCEDIIDELN